MGNKDSKGEEKRKRRPSSRPSSESKEQLGYVFKIVILGDGAVGKTSLRKRFLGEGFNSEYLMTVGADFAKHQLTISEEIPVTFQIWDLAGQPRFEAVRDIYYRGAQGGLVVFDVTRRTSFENIGKWIEELWAHNGHGAVPYILIGNKSDLRTSSLGISVNEIDQMKRILVGEAEPFDFTIEYIETSALTGINVDKAFEYLAEIIWLWMKKKGKI